MLFDIEEMAKKIDRINVALMIVLTELNQLTGDGSGRIQFAKEVLAAKYPVPPKTTNVLESTQDEKKEILNGQVKL